MTNRNMDWNKYKNNKDWYNPLIEIERRGNRAATKVAIEQLQLAELSVASPSDYRHLMKLFGRVQKLNRRDKEAGDYEIWVQSRLTQFTMEIQRKGKGSPDEETHMRAQEIASITNIQDRMKAISDHRIAFAEARGIAIT